jgi:hypothetical protein
VNSICQHGRCCYSFNTREGVRHRLAENGVKRNHYQNGVRHHIQTVTVPHGRWCPNLNRSHVKNARYCHSESRCFSGGTKNLDCTEGNERLRRECHRSSQILRLPTYNVGILRMTFLRGLISLLKLGHYHTAGSSCAPAVVNFLLKTKREMQDVEQSSEAGIAAEPADQVEAVAK